MNTLPNAPALPNADSNGITIREHIATMLMQGMLSRESSKGDLTAHLAAAAVSCADDLIAELNKTQPQP